LSHHDLDLRFIELSSTPVNLSAHYGGPGAKMAITRRIGALAAIAGLTAAIALQTGLPPAQADELSDLQANIQLLQQRIDQLEKQQAAQQPGEQQAAVEGGPVVAGAPAMAGSFPRSFLIPGTNTSIRFSGYIKFDAAE
jgi:hypothetical protein